MVVQEEEEIEEDQPENLKQKEVSVQLVNHSQNLREEELKVDLVVVQVIQLIKEDLVFQGEKKAKVAAEDLQEEDQREEQVVRELVVRIREDLECAEDAEGEVEEEVEQEIRWHSHSS